MYKTKPYQHQRDALIKGADQYNFAYFMEMGTGKTKVSIDNAAYLYQEKKVNVVLVVAPNSVYRNWQEEIKTTLYSLEIQVWGKPRLPRVWL